MLPYLIAGAIGFGIGKLFENGGETFMAGGVVDSYSVDYDDVNGQEFRDDTFDTYREAKLKFDELSKKGKTFEDVPLDSVQLVQVYKNGEYEILDSKFFGNYAGGGGVPKKRRRSVSAQYGRSDTSFDKQLTAKPVGYRFTNAKANQLRKDPFAKPTEAQVKKYLGKGIYKENRRNRSDRDRNAKL